jgi:hypothetical protein
VHTHSFYFKTKFFDGRAKLLYKTTPFEYHICVARTVFWAIIVQCNPLFRDHPYPRPVAMLGIYQTPSKKTH